MVMPMLHEDSAIIRQLAEKLDYIECAIGIRGETGK
jgi:hypothetical protein